MDDGQATASPTSNRKRYSPPLVVPNLYLDFQKTTESRSNKDSRSFSGATLVNEQHDDNVDGDDIRLEKTNKENDGAIVKIEINDRPTTSGIIPTNSTKSSRAISKIGKFASKMASVLGKRHFEEDDSHKEENVMSDSDSALSSVPDTEEDEGEEGDEEELKSDMVAQKKGDGLKKAKEPSKKKVKVVKTVMSIPAAISEGTKQNKTRKVWLTHGLYIGQEERKETNESEKTTAEKVAVNETRRHFQLPMYWESTRQSDFHIPYNVFAPMKRKENPKDWKKLSKNSFTPDAREFWRSQKLEASKCLCKTPPKQSNVEGCGENCLNRTMLYECDNENCALTEEQCSNRAFLELAKRSKNGNEYDIGVEIVHTRECGYGLRANRAFQPDQIIIEYCGEVITPEESDRRTTEIYKDNKCFYLMEFDQGMIIDATKGNLTRFVNHSCAPNCVMEKRIVKGEPRMALFAGSKGVQTGEELTYDYNFDNFSTLNMLDCRCGAELCRGKLERRDWKKEKENLTASLKRKLAEAMSATPEPVGERKVLKKRKTQRWSKGWSYVDPELEALRVQEDAMERGQPLTKRLSNTFRKDAEDRKIKVREPTILGRSTTRIAKAAAKVKISHKETPMRVVGPKKRPSAVTKSMEEEEEETSQPEEKPVDTKPKEKRRSILGLAASLFKSATALLPLDLHHSLSRNNTSHDKGSINDEPPLLASSGNSRLSVESKSSQRSTTQTKLNFETIPAERRGYTSH